MALTKFNKNINYHESLPDQPTKTAEELKRLFDQAGLDIKEYLNTILTEELDAKETEIRASITNVAATVNTSLGGMFDRIYPVGSIYMSVNSTNPTDLFGGTWVAWGAGRVPVGINTEETEFNTVEKTGGEKGHTLLAGEMPQHTHSLNNHTHTYDKASITGQASGNTGSTALSVAQLPGHNHTFTGVAHNHGTGSSGYKFLVSKNNISANSTKRAWPSSSSSGQHYIFTDDDNPGVLEDSKTANATQGGSIGNTGSGQGHTHSLNNHTHTITSASANTGVNNIETGASGSNGSHNNLQPYVTCYMWKRTA